MRTYSSGFVTNSSTVVFTIFINTKPFKKTARDFLFTKKFESILKLAEEVANNYDDGSDIKVNPIGPVPSKDSYELGVISGSIDDHVVEEPYEIIDEIWAEFEEKLKASGINANLDIKTVR